MVDANAAAPERIDAGQLARRWGRSPVTISRYVYQGLLAEPHHFLGRRMWLLSDVEIAEVRLSQRGADVIEAKRVNGARLAAAGRAAKAARRAAP